MATQTRIKSVLEEVCTWSYDYDDVTFKILRFRCVNNHPTLTSEGRAWDDEHPIGDAQHQEIVRTVPPMTTDVFNFPVAVQNRFDLRVSPTNPNRLIGMDCAFRFLPA